MRRKMEGADVSCGGTDDCATCGGESVAVSFRAMKCKHNKARSPDSDCERECYAYAHVLTDEFIQIYTTHRLVRILSRLLGYGVENAQIRGANAESPLLP